MTRDEYRTEVETIATDVISEADWVSEDWTGDECTIEHWWEVADEEMQAHCGQHKWCVGRRSVALEVLDLASASMTEMLGTVDPRVELLEGGIDGLLYALAYQALYRDCVAAVTARITDEE
jgi:hypothetical protein